MPNKFLRYIKERVTIKVVITIPIGLFLGVLLLFFYNYLKTNNNSLVIGDEVIVQNAVASDGKEGVYLRRNSNRGNKEVGAVFNGATGKIIKGPESEDDHRWWKVLWNAGPKVDWSREYPCNQPPCEAWIAEKVNDVVVLAKKK